MRLSRPEHGAAVLGLARGAKTARRSRGGWTRRAARPNGGTAAAGLVDAPVIRFPQRRGNPRASAFVAEGDLCDGSAESLARVFRPDRRVLRPVAMVAPSAAATENRC